VHIRLKKRKNRFNISETFSNGAALWNAELRAATVLLGPSRLEVPLAEVSPDAAQTGTRVEEWSS
jgi:hypothetical protein